MRPFCIAMGTWVCFHNDGRAQLFSRKWANIPGSALARYLLAGDACYHRGRTTRLRRFATDCEIKVRGHRVPPAGLPIEQVLGQYSLSFLRRDVAYSFPPEPGIASEIGSACLRSSS